MGIFNIFKKDKKSLVKLEERQEVVNKICLKKKELTDLKANVMVVLDFSGSMSNLYENGTVQETLNRLLPLAMKFDDNGEMPFYIFSNDYHELKTVTLNNFEDYIEKEKPHRKYHMGGTRYSNVCEHIVSNYKNNKTPTFVLFITDGECSDRNSSEKIIRESSKYPIFWQFVGIGNERFDFLQNLDDMEREVDNTDFFSVRNISRIEDKELYENLLGEFPSWIKVAKSKGIL